MLRAYVGTYAPNGGGVYGFTCGPQPPPARLGAPMLECADSPSWLTVSACGRRLYAVHELHRGAGGGHGRISSHAIAADGSLQFLGECSSGGVRPVHLSLHPGGGHAFVAHYDSAEVTVLGLDATGTLGPLLHRQPLASALGDRLGPERALRAPPGSFARSGHDAAHAHMALCDASGRYVLCSALAHDALVAWRFDARHARLSHASALHLSPGAGPRHLVFHPRDATQLYLLNEESSTLAWLRLQDGALRLVTELSCLPPNYVGTAYASDLCCTADGRHLYALNRLHDSIAHFSIDLDGSPRLRSCEWSRGSYPRSLRLVPGGGLVVCNERSDHLAWFGLRADGSPRFSGRYTGVGGAATVVFVGRSLRGSGVTQLAAGP